MFAVVNQQTDPLIVVTSAFAMVLVFGVEKLYLRLRSGDQKPEHEAH